MYKKFETVGELIDILKTLPLDTKIVTKNSNTMEQRGYSLGNIINISTEKYKITREETFDAFDGTPYSYNCITPVLNDEQDNCNMFEAIKLP